MESITTTNWKSCYHWVDNKFQPALPDDTDIADQHSEEETMENDTDRYLEAVGMKDESKDHLAGSTKFPTNSATVNFQIEIKEKGTQTMPTRRKNQSSQVDAIKTRNKSSQTNSRLMKSEQHIRSVRKLKNKVKSLKRKVKRKDKKIKTVTDLVNVLKRKRNLNGDLEMVLRNTFSGFPLEFILSLHSNNKQNKRQRRYSPLMKQFSLTLFYYSPKAYRFVRKLFTLPHPSRITAWITNVNCEPGFISEVLRFLKETQKEHSKQIDVGECALIVDAMSIREQLVWDSKNKNFAGHVNIGGITNQNSEALAKEALVFQIVSLSSSFKTPVAYFLTNGISADVLANLTNACISKLHEVGVVVRCLTCDGTSVNIQALNILNCGIGPEHIEPSFQHPTDPTIKVYAFLDPCHMLKLARNALAEKGEFESCEGTISWKYIQHLNDLQNEEKLKLANSLSDNHIFFQNRKMKVSLAAQTLSASVANSLEFLEINEHPNFQGAGPTVSFIRHVDKLFDILNSKNIFGKGFKQPMRIENVQMILDYLEEVKTYLDSLKIEHIKATFHARRTFVIGFKLCIETLKQLAPELLFREENPLKYLLTYKMSQDHIEILFSHLRSKGGWNNNPNCLQLKYSLRALLLKPLLTTSKSANVSDYFTSSVQIVDFKSRTLQLNHEDEEDDEEINDEEVLELFNSIDSIHLSNFKRNIVYYISGFIVRKISKGISCEDCLKILFQHKKTAKNEHTYFKTSLSDYTAFQNKINAGGLVFASETVFKIVEYTEKSFIQLMSLSFKMYKNRIAALVSNVVKHFSTDCTLPSLAAHPIDSAFDVEDLHETKLVKKIVNAYLNIRCKAHGKEITNRVLGKKIGLRQKLTKLVTFSNV